LAAAKENASVIEPRILEVRTKILKKNDELAREMRERFVRAGVLVVNMVSSPGTGKTAFLKQTLARQRRRRALTV
jgi:hydrogenase nickel incorporation protein HypB